MALASPAASGADFEDPVAPGSAPRIDEDQRLEDRIERRLSWDRELAPYDLANEIRLEEPGT